METIKSFSGSVRMEDGSVLHFKDGKCVGLEFAARLILDPVAEAVTRKVCQQIEDAILGTLDCAYTWDELSSDQPVIVRESCE
jgi:hypothetical protein